LGNLSVQHQARVIEVRYSSPDPVQAASFVNTLIREYRRQGQDSQQKDMQELGQWLDNQNQALKQSIEKTESQLAGYANGKGLVYTEEHGSSVVAQRLRLTSEDLSQAQADRMVKQSRSEQAAAASADSLPQSLENGSVRDYQVKLTELRTQLEQLKSVLSPKSYKVQSVESQIAVVKSALDNELANTKKRLENEYKAALNREQMVQSRYNRQLQQAAGETAESVHYGSLKRDLETAQTLRAQIQQKEQQVGMAAVAPNSHLRTIGQATPPSRPYKPNYWLNLSLAIFGGLLIGGMLALLQEHRHRAFRAPGEAFTRLQLPELGAILSAGGNALPLRRALKAGAFDNRLELAAWQKQVSPLVESIHDAVTSLLTRCEAGPTVVLITSPCAGDGKTTIVTNLAIALAQCNRRVLLIDGDVRRPRIHKIFNLPARPGLSDLLRKGAAAGSGAPATITNPLSIPNLHVMTCGSPIPPNVPLFSDSQLPRLLMRLRTEYDAVLIDAPPVLQGPNARLLGRLCDAVILVLRAGRTTHKEATASLTRLFNDNIQVAGTILNDWDPRGDDSPYSYASRSAYATAAKWEDD
jgi:capsular exopolysaccharide synthesis family protein